jgi:NADPH2:quinone reductase
VVGVEGAGVIEEIAPGADLRAGDRVVWTQVMGSQSTHLLVPVERLVRIPEGIGYGQAAGLLQQGLTAYFLTRSVWKVGSSSTVVVQAASGGVGRFICQLAKLEGARVIAVVGSAGKSDGARAAGADEVIVRDEDDMARRVAELTGGEKANVVFDGVGRDTFDASLACLGPRGALVLFGQSSGPVPPFAPQTLAKGSLFVTRPSFADYLGAAASYRRAAEDLLELVRQGIVTVHIDRTLPLEAIAEAHRALETRETSGKVVLLPHTTAGPGARHAT